MNSGRHPLILIADDDPDFVRILSHHLRSWSFDTACAGDKAQLLETITVRKPDLIILDVRFGSHDGVEILRQLRENQPDLPVMMLTAYGAIDNAITAIRLGAAEYLTKPLDIHHFRADLNRILDERVVSSSKSANPEGLTRAGRLSRPILGESRAILDLRALIDRVAPTDASVLILGESGTGKELVARAIHERGRRSVGPFVPLNMAALPRELAESVLFGHGKGAFTGADQMQRGCCEAADRGTLFLDEIGEMELVLQAKLLRFLQERSFLRVGQVTPVEVDVRIIAATHRNPLDQVRRGLLREDLFYRLNVVPIVLPALRERREDIPLLIDHFLRRFASRSGQAGLKITPAAVEELQRYDWPGNVRELENLIERLVIMYPGPVLDLEVVHEGLNSISNLRASTGTDHLRSGGTRGVEQPRSYDLTQIERLEREAIIRALTRAESSVKTAAHDLGLSPATVYRKIKRYGITQ